MLNCISCITAEIVRFLTAHYILTDRF